MAPPKAINPQPCQLGLASCRKFDVLMSDRCGMSLHLGRTARCDVLANGIQRVIIITLEACSIVGHTHLPPC